MKTNQRLSPGSVKSCHPNQTSKNSDLSIASGSKQTESSKCFPRGRSMKQDTVERFTCSQASRCLDSPYKNFLSEIKCVTAAHNLKDDFKTPTVLKTKSKANHKSTKKGRNLTKLKTKNLNKKIKQNHLIKFTEVNFRQTDVNPNHLQMALALSKSTYNDENPGTFEDLEDLPTFLSQEKIAKVKTTLERYGFRSNKPKVNIEVPKRSRVSDFRFFAPILQTRKDEERETLIASKVSLILQQTNSDTTELQTRQNKNEVVSGVLKKFCRDEIPVFAASGLNLEETIKFSYYSKNLNITPNRGNCGCLLRKWDDIPGREKTPERYEQRSIKNASNQFRTWQTIKDISQEHQIKHNNSNTLTNLAEENLSTRNNCVSPDLFDSDDEFNCSPKTLQSEVILSQPLLNLSPLNRQDLFRSRSSKIVNDSEPKKLKISNCEIFKSENGILHFESYNSDFENLSEDAYIITQCLEEKNTEILDLTKDLKKDEIELYGLTKPVDVSPKYRIGILNQNQRYDLNNETANEKTVTLRMDLDNYDKNFPEKESVIIQCLKSPKEMDLGLLKTYEIDNEAEVYDLTQSSPDEISDTESKDLLDLYEKHDMSNKTPKEKSVMKEADTDFDMTPLCIQNSSGALVANSARLETQSFCNVSEQNDDLCNMSYSSNCNRDGIYCFGSSKWLNVTDYVNQILTDEVITNQDYAEELNLCQVGGINLSQVSSSQDSIVISDEELNYSSIQSKSVKKGCFYELSDNDDNEDNKNGVVEKNINDIDDLHSVLKNKYGKQESSGLVHNRITQLKNASITRESLVNAFLEESFNASCEDKGNVNSSKEKHNLLQGSSLVKKSDDEEKQNLGNKCEKLITPEKATCINVQSAITPENNLIIKTKDITPMLNYDEFDTPIITKELQKFGLKPLKRQRGVKLLKYLYECTHPLVGPNEINELNSDEDDHQTVKRRKKLTTKKTDKSTQIINAQGERKHTAEESIFEDLLENENIEDFIFERKHRVKVPSCQAPLQIVWHNFICSNPKIKENILLYEPLQLEILHSMLKEQSGCKFHIQDLLTFLDKKCITVRTGQVQDRRTRIKT